MARKAKNSIFKIKGGGGLLWSKLSAEIPHYLNYGQFDQGILEKICCWFSRTFNLEINTAG